MRNYRYIKMVPVTVTVPVLPLVSMSLGAAILIWVIWPIATFKLTYAKSRGVVTPIAEDINDQTALQTGTDYSKASNWFPQAQSTTTDSPVGSYTISIPSLGINNALVRIGTDDLSKSIIHYGGTGIPGKRGNPVLFGHSILPQFFDPKNYLSIFSLLPKLKEGDDIFVHFDGVDYRYEVVSARVTTPEDVSGLEQKYDDSYITLVTCVPAGTYLERLWLVARQKPFGQTP